MVALLLLALVLLVSFLAPDPSVLLAMDRGEAKWGYGQIKRPG